MFNFLRKLNNVNYLFVFFVLIQDSLNYLFKKYIFTINHKKIALNYFWFSFLSGMSGTSLATMIRLELAYSGSHFFKGDSIKYLQVITAHGLIMVFFVVVPLIFGFFANFFIPYHVGSKDVAFPRLNSIGFWILPSGFILLAKPAFLRRQMYHSWDNLEEYNLLVKQNNILFSNNFIFNYKKTWRFFSFKKDVFFDPLIFFENLPNSNYYESFWSIINNRFLINKEMATYSIECKNSSATMSGWTFITPMSGDLKYTGFGAQDIAIISVIFAGLTTTISFTNLLITRRTLSMPGLRNRKSLLPFLSISLFLVMRMLALIIPVLGAAMIMLEFDRHWNTAFFDYTYGGDTILFHHLFWFFGHPEVYVVIIPGFGIVNMLLPFYNTRRITSKNHLIWATYIMAYMGFLVWGHHMYLVGLDHRSRSLFSTITIMISLPAVVKIVNWTLTLLNGALKIDTAFLFVMCFFLFFLSGGLTGMWLSHVSLNIYVHDTFYVVAHFHFLFSAATFSSIFAGLYYYYGTIFGIKYNRLFSYFHVFYWFFGQWLTFLPLYWVGYNGLPRRYHDYPLLYSSWQGLSSLGHIINLFSIIFFFLVLVDSHVNSFSSENIHSYIPRWHKRSSYYFFKIKNIQIFQKINFYFFNCLCLKFFLLFFITIV